MSKSEYKFRVADENDVEHLMSIINAAFSVEDFIFSKSRIDIAGMLDHMNKGQFIAAENSEQLGTPVGCVYVETSGEKGYFGLLSVDPSQQGRGLGAQLIEKAEDACRLAGHKIMAMNIISLRTELPAFYKKFGYVFIRDEFRDLDPSTLQPYHYIIFEKPLVS